MSKAIMHVGVTPYETLTNSETKDVNLPFDDLSENVSKFEKTADIVNGIYQVTTGQTIGQIIPAISGEDCQFIFIKPTDAGDPTIVEFFTTTVAYIEEGESFFTVLAGEIGVNNISINGDGWSDALVSIIVGY